MHDVAIIGAGPTGIIAANLCGVYGLSAVALDREKEVYNLPRAVGMWDDVQRILHDAGVLEPALPAMCEHVGAEFVDSSGRRINGIDLPAGSLTPNGFPVIRGFHQPEFERAARACLSRFENVELKVGREAIEIAQDDDRVRIQARDRATGAVDELDARWLIGCDGASSFVRKSCGIAWDSLGYDQEWLVVDVQLKRDVALPPRMQQICDPDRPTTLIPLPMRMHRWEFQLREDETRAEMESRQRVWELLEPWLSPRDAEMVRAVVYRFHATIADTFRRGRVLLAGDAAHQTPPFMGQGLCSGLRDANNLIWKIAHVERGLAGDRLLDTYTEERRPMAVASVEHSVNTGRLIDAYAAMDRGGPEPSPELQAYAYGGNAQLPHLSTGLLNGASDSEWVGRLVPRSTVDVEGRTGPFDDVVGPRWAVVTGEDAHTERPQELQRRWQQLGAAHVSVPAPDSAMAALLAASETIVVRPDRIIYATADVPPDV